MKNFLTDITGRLGASDPLLIVFVPAVLLLLAAALVFLIRTAAPRRRFKKAAAGGALFPLWIAAQKNGALKRLFIAWAKEQGEEAGVRLLAASCRGEDFAVQGVFFDPEQQGDLLRELTGNAEWYVRYFAYRMLLPRTDPRTARTLEDGLADSHPLIRKTLVLHVHHEDREKFYGVLWNTLIHDPV
jgi:hypothetical protein